MPLAPCVSTASRREQGQRSAFLATDAIFTPLCLIIWSNKGYDDSNHEDSVPFTRDLSQKGLGKVMSSGPPPWLGSHVRTTGRHKAGNGRHRRPMTVSCLPRSGLCTSTSLWVLFLLLLPPSCPADGPTNQVIDPNQDHSTTTHACPALPAGLRPSDPVIVAAGALLNRWWARRVAWPLAWCAAPRGRWPPLASGGTGSGSRPGRSARGAAGPATGARTASQPMVTLNERGEAANRQGGSLPSLPLSLPGARCVRSARTPRSGTCSQPARPVPLVRRRRPPPGACDEE